MIKSAGILLFKKNPLEVFLVHPGGPFWAKKDEGAWTIPKGMVEEGEDPEETAIREFHEETGTTIEIDSEKLITIETVKLKSGKVIYGWSYEYLGDKFEVNSNKVKTEWPPKTGHFLEFPEVDKGEWFNLETAKQKLNPAQAQFVDNLVNLLSF